MRKLEIVIVSSIILVLSYGLLGCGEKYTPILIKESSIPVVLTNEDGTTQTNDIVVTNAVANPDWITGINAAKGAADIATMAVPNPFSPLASALLGLFGSGLVGAAGLIRPIRDQ